MPPADKAASRNATLGNAYAALAELYHFQAKRTRYQTSFDKSEAPVIDQDPPFARLSILPFPQNINPKEQATAAARAARGLFLELLTPAGRVADDVRDVARTDPAVPHPPAAWPHPFVAARAPRRHAPVRPAADPVDRQDAALRNQMPIG